MTDHAHAHHAHALDASAGAKVKDPVCGMSVDPATSKHRADHAGETFHFCCAGCKTKFEADPSRYLADGGKPPALAPAVLDGSLLSKVHGSETRLKH